MDNNWIQQIYYGDKHTLQKIYIISEKVANEKKIAFTSSVKKFL